METRQVALFVTCLVDTMRPNIGFAAAKLLEDAGFEVVVPEGQTCCGQPNFNGGDHNAARVLAARHIRLLEPFPYVVVPSGSCAATIKCHYPELFETGTSEHTAAEALAAKTYELTRFLTDIADSSNIKAAFDGSVTYHDSCSGLRELGIKAQPRDLLAKVSGLSVKEMAEPEVCCGFGGTFCIKYPDISNHMVTEKAEDIEKTGADALIAGDLGCLMNMEGKLHRRSSNVKAYHIAEILAGMADKEQA